MEKTKEYLQKRAQQLDAQIQSLQQELYEIYSALAEFEPKTPPKRKPLWKRALLFILLLPFPFLWD